MHFPFLDNMPGVSLPSLEPNVAAFIGSGVVLLLLPRCNKPQANNRVNSANDDEENYQHFVDNIRSICCDSCFIQDAILLQPRCSKSQAIFIQTWKKQETSDDQIVDID